MKKLLLLSLATLTVFCFSQQTASAWFNVRLKAGFDFRWQSGNNSYLWGLVHDGPHGYPLAHHHHGYHPVLVLPAPAYYDYHPGYYGHGHSAGHSGSSTTSSPSVNQAYYQHSAHYSGHYYPQYQYSAPTYGYGY